MFIVTGGAGFIGSAIVWKLNTLGIDSILVVDNLATSEKWKNLVNRTYAAYMHRDDFLTAIRGNTLPYEGIKGIFHMGACSSTTERDADFLMRNNLEYTKALCAFALQNNIRFINASSASTYGDGALGFDDDMGGLHALRPLNMYGYSKQLFDLWALGNGLFETIVSLKFFNVYGPNEQHKGEMRSVVNKAFHQIDETGGMKLFRSSHPDYADGGQMRDFVYVKDCVDIMLWLYDNPKINGVFNVGTGQARTWNDLATAVFRAMGREPAIDYVDMPVQLRGKYQNFTEAAMARLQAAGYTAPMTSLEAGVTDYVQKYLMRNNAHL